jgi:hypothetical protein
MTSGLPPETDILRAGRHVSNVPIAAIGHRFSMTSSARVDGRAAIGCGRQQTAGLSAFTGRILNLACLNYERKSS